jgi:hypothetical protein
MDATIATAKKNAADAALERRGKAPSSRATRRPAYL